MRQPSKRLIIAAALSLVVGYAISWAIMVFVLATEYRLYGFVYLTAVAATVAMLIACGHSAARSEIARAIAQGNTRHHRAAAAWKDHAARRPQRARTRRSVH